MNSASETSAFQQPTPVHVALPGACYEIHIGSGLIASAGELIKPLLSRSRLAIVCDEMVASHYLHPVSEALHKSGISNIAITFPPGESSKSFHQLERVCSALIDADIERRDTILALGGGVSGDLAGFAAAILRRGVAVIQMPTTLLSQVDSSVGGKTGINMPQGKNLVGAFHQPRQVLIDIDTLDSLPARHMRAGYAEVLKYGLINQPGFFDWLEESGARILSGDKAAQGYAIAQSCAAKAAIVAADEKEQGDRALLNLGHTFGHALEAAMGYDGRLLHGEAVAIGCVMAFDLSVALGHAPESAAHRVRHHLLSLGFELDLGSFGISLETEQMLALMGQDKKVDAGQMTFILAGEIGKSFISRDVPLAQLKAVIDRWLR